ncbi:MAG: hypothetical protein MZV64_28540 [Ignavibacteriales bacterium]|nr:hypothetical protein [Ignavibacteriales bacterium]
MTITELDGFEYVDDGAGVLVIYEEPGKPLSHIDLRDGIDLAFRDFPPRGTPRSHRNSRSPLQIMPAMATLSMFFSSVSGIVSGSGADRPSSIEVTVGGLKTVYSNLLKSGDGQEWDTQNIPLSIPAGVTSLTVQAFSRADYPSPNLPASFFWLAAGLAIMERPLKPEKDARQATGSNRITSGTGRRPTSRRRCSTMSLRMRSRERPSCRFSSRAAAG